MKPTLATAETQLLLFDRDTSTSECGNSYQSGDWVKLRRKPRIAAWVKRGDIFKINAVHPKDGSMRFWNPHINQWDFLYPEEVRLTLPPKEESVVGEVAKKTVQSVVGEIAKETVESVVGEIAKETVESVVGEIAKKTVQSVVGEIAKETVESVVGEIAKETVESVVGEIAKKTVQSVVGEIAKETVESVVGEIAKETVESVVGEIAKETVESVVGEIAKETVQSVVGEIAKETVESVVGEPQGTVESIVGEILAAKNYWNSDRGYSGNGWLESHYKIRRDRKQYSINYPEIGCTSL